LENKVEITASTLAIIQYFAAHFHNFCNHLCIEFGTFL
jgi:hypothetical protein